jgi:hypothetical protein
MTESKGLAFTFCFFNHLYGHENKYIAMTMSIPTPYAQEHAQIPT